jgi:hypothetical protein
MPQKQNTTIKTRDIALNPTSTTIICLGLVETNLKHKKWTPMEPQILKPNPKLLLVLCRVKIENNL